MTSRNIKKAFTKHERAHLKYMDDCVAVIVERNRRSRQLAHVAATVAAAGLALAVIALPIGWMLTW